MSDVTRGLSASEAAIRLGVSAKALRLYERQDWLRPDERWLDTGPMARTIWRVRPKSRRFARSA